MDNSATVEISREHIIKFLEQHKIEVKQLNLSEQAEATQEKDKKDKKEEGKK